MASICEIQDFIHDISIIDKRIVICSGASKEAKVQDGVIERFLFDSDSWSTIIICCLGKGQKAIYSVILNHKLVRKLQTVAKLNELVQQNSPEGLTI